LVSSVSWNDENILNDSAAPERSIVCRQRLTGGNLGFMSPFVRSPAMNDLSIRTMRHGLGKFLTQGATQRLLRLLMMTKQMRLNAFAMTCVAHRPDRAIDRKTKIFCRSPRFQARTLRIRVNYKLPFP
jgi:hypothetical protein